MVYIGTTLPNHLPGNWCILHVQDAIYLFSIVFWKLFYVQVSGWHFLFIFFKLGFTPCKAEQPLQGMELHEKEVQKD